ncbi:D-alanine--D-alanine ligase family protein [Candidatus Blochmannia ocreatus (nom. nud.)]|uniref:D-alanine--D-alanine ligase n=1 Tax=Candidatus Blochmannia ocreatus (nom. nud.) TaxID=251538 RepID=A0ABY4SSJ6_9ENTR|nr:D-alanine--D-alanine ligase family protein [Candidatus Blochmannia ocreatus]URJ24966.1 D-alanine--D-alanine ligase [Candidatus Blochmannia ocreatus]
MHILKKKKLCVGIICGGFSFEYEISLRSAIYIAQSIDINIFKVVILLIDKKGCWYLRDINFEDLLECQQDDTCVSIVLQKKLHKLALSCNNINYLSVECDVFFPVVHGSPGEDGALQGLLRIMNVPYVGSDILASSVCMDKNITKCLLRDSGLLVAPFRTFYSNHQDDINFADLVNLFGLPLFVKPANQGSSIGVQKVFSDKSFHQAVLYAFSFSNKILVEQAIYGRELECAVLGNDNLEISVFGEIILPEGDTYTYCHKYLDNVVQIKIPAAVDNIIKGVITEVVLCAVRLFHCTGMARVDMFLTPENKIFINEINTVPGFTQNSMYPKLWEATGLSVRELITKLIDLALERHKY